MAFFRKIFALLLVAFLFAVPSVRAWSLFGSGDKAGKVLQVADRNMERADAEFEKGEYERARELFAQALDGFMQVEAIAPDYKNGLPAMRIQYCASQITNAVIAMAGGSVATEQVANEAADRAGRDLRNVAPVVPSVPVAPARVGPAIAPATSVRATSSGPVVPPPVLPAAVAASPSPADPVQPPAAPVHERPADARNYIHDFNEARVLVEEGFLSEAIDILIPLLRQDPGNRSLRLMIAIVRTRQGRFDEAIGALEDLRGRQEDLPILLAISGAYLGAGRYPDALLALDRAIKIAPDDPNAYSNLAWLSLVMPGSGRDALANAEAYYRQAIKRGAARDRALEKRIGLTKW